MRKIKTVYRLLRKWHKGSILKRRKGISIQMQLNAAEETTLSLIHFYFRCSLGGLIRILNTEKVGTVSTVASLFANLRPCSNGS